MSDKSVATTEDVDDLEVLEYETVDVEPDAAPPIKVKIGGEFYVARCPNMFEMTEIAKQLKNASKRPLEFDLSVILNSFFSDDDAYKIAEDSRGQSPKINLFHDLLPALNALGEHYLPLVEANAGRVQKQVSAPKGSNTHQRGGRKR